MGIGFKIGDCDCGIIYSDHLCYSNTTQHVCVLCVSINIFL